MLNFGEIKARLNGQWDSVFMALAPQLEDAIRKAPKQLGVPDPVSGGKDGFRLFKDFKEVGGSVSNPCDFHTDGISTLSYVLQCSNGEVFKLLNEYVGGDVKITPMKPIIPKEKPVESIDRSQLLNGMWLKSKSILDSPVEVYLQSRGLDMVEDLSDTFRYSTYLKSPFDKRIWGGLISKFSDENNEMKSIHRTLLTKSGEKAPLDKVKLMMPSIDGSSVSGGAIKPWVPDDWLGVAEGIETGLAARLGSDMPVWMTYSAALMPKLAIPKQVRNVVIWADKDAMKKGVEAGMVAATKLADRLVGEGLRVFVNLPPGELSESQKSIDWADIWQNGNHSAFKRLTLW